MCELTVAAVELAPFAVEADDGLDFPVEQAMNGMTSRFLIGKCSRPLPVQPTVSALFLHFEIFAGVPEAPALIGRIRDQIKQNFLGGRVDASGDLATYPQPSFPSARVSFTAIRVIVSDNRSISDFASVSSACSGLE